MTAQPIRREQRAREAGAEVIVHDQNQGKGEAIKTGLAHWLGAANPSSSGQDRQITWAILLDSDGQHLPEEIDRFLLAAASVTRPTFFIGNRMGDVARMPFVRRVVNRYMSKQISRVCGQKIPDTQCGYRMLHRQLIPDMLGGGHRFDYDTEALIIASRKGYRIESVPITTVYTDQVSKIHPVRDCAPLSQIDAAISKGIASDGSDGRNRVTTSARITVRLWFCCRQRF